MKIGINARFLTKPNTGIGQYTINLLTALSEIDKQNIYFLTVPDKVDFQFGENFKIAVIPESKVISAGLKKAWWEQIQVPAFFLNAKVDFAHFLYPSNPFLYFGFQSMVTVHDTIPYEFPEYKTKWTSRLANAFSLRNLRKTVRLVTVSEYVKIKIQKLINYENEKVSVIYNAAAEFYKQPAGEEEKKQVKEKFKLPDEFLFYVGGFDDRKNVKILKKAFNDFVAPEKNISLVLAGNKLFDTKLYDSYDYWPSKESKSKILQIGFVSETELRALYAMSLGFVHLSREEGFNIPVVEAASCGAPLLLSEIETHREIAGDGAYYCDPKDISGTGKALLAFIENENLRRDLKLKSQNLSQKFLWENSARQLLEVYDGFK